MQTSPQAVRISAVAHSESAVLPFADGQVVVDDQRLRNWQSAEIGALNYASPVRAIKTDDGNILRIRVVDSLYSGLLDIRYASPSDSITWSANTVSFDALERSGVDIVANGTEVDAFWVDGDGVTIKTAHSSDYGHTWGSASDVATVPAQGTNITVQLTAPSPDILFYTDSTLQFTASAVLTGIYIVIRVSGVWNTPTFWDLGAQPLGIASPITLPNGAAYPSNLSSVILNDSQVVLSYYGSEFRQVFTDGLYTQLVSNIDTTNATQHLHWGHPQQYLPTLRIDDDNSSSQTAMNFPRLQAVGSEYWMIALESSLFAGHQRYHLGFIRSTDSVHFQDRDYHQGASDDEQSGAYVYDGGSPFQLTDLLYANLVVCDTFTYIVGFDRTFWCPSTTLVGVTNPDRQLDLTNYVTDWSVNLPAAPGGGSASYSLGNVPKNWNSSDLLAAHRGIRILHKAGYRTDLAHGDEFVDVGQFWIDTVTQHTEIGNINGQVETLDSAMLLDRWKSDVYWNYRGTELIPINSICDMTPFIIIQGSMQITGNGTMRSGVVQPRDTFKDDVAVLNTEQANDGFFMILRFRSDKTWADNHAGIAFMGQELGDQFDNKRWWGVYYNHPRSTGKFSLVETVPVTKPNIATLYRFRPPVQESSDIALDFHRWYWLKVGVWHGHVMAWYSTDSTDADGIRVPDANWTQVIDYTTPATPQHEVLPCRIGWQGIVGTQKTNPSGAIGVLATDGGQQTLDDGAGNPIMVATRIQLGDDDSILRRINVVLTQENTGSMPMPDANIILASGDDTSPDDLTDEDNVLYAKDASALHFSTHDSPNWIGANATQNPTRLRLEADSYVWVVVTFNSPLVAGQSYKWASTASGGVSKKSTDGGATWSDAPAVMTASIEVEYLNGMVRFGKLWYGAGDNVKTYEELAHQIASKAGVLDLTAFDWLSQADMSIELDGFLWQPASFGTIGDLVLEADYHITDDYYSGAQPLRVFVGSSTIGNGDGNGFIIEVDGVTQSVSTYGVGNVAIEIESSLQWIPLIGHLQVVVQKQYIYVYLNECLAYVGYNHNFSTEGYVGVDPNGVTWTNLRIPDLHQLVDYFDIEANETALSSLQKLIAKPAPGTVARGKFFIRYDGSLEIGSYQRRQVVDTYENTLLSADKSETGQYVVSVISASGNYYSTRTDPAVLDLDGRVYDQRDVTDGRSDADAYAATEDEFRDAKEKAITPTITNLSDYAMEREDLHFVINPLDHTTGYEIVNSINWELHPDSGDQVVQKVTYRQFEGQVVE